MSTLSLQEALIPSTNFPVFLPCGGVQRRRSPTVLFAASRSKQAKHATAGKARPSLACVVSPPSYTYRCQPYGTRTEQHTKLYKLRLALACILPASPIIWTHPWRSSDQITCLARFQLHAVATKPTNNHSIKPTLLGDLRQVRPPDLTSRVIN